MGRLCHREPDRGRLGPHPGHAAGAEIDLLLELGGQRGTWAVEIKRGLSANPQRGFYQVLEDVQPARACVVHAGEDSYPISEDIEAIGPRELAGLLRGKANEGE